MAETHLAVLLRTLSEGLDRQHVRAVLFGGFALPMYGVERLTLDLDFLLAETDLDGFGMIVQPLGYQIVLRTPQYAKFRHPARDALDIDTVFVDPPSMERIWWKSVDYVLGGSVVRCASLDILLGTKLHAIRHNEALRGRRDLDDVLRLLAANHVDPEGEWFGLLCRRYGTTDIRERVCRELRQLTTN